MRLEMWAALIIVVCCMLGVVTLEASDHPPPLIGGTVVSIDQEALALALRMPTEEIRSFVVVDRRLFKGISVGDHVSVEMNDEGRVTALIELPTDTSN